MFRIIVEEVDTTGSQAVERFRQTVNAIDLPALIAVINRKPRAPRKPRTPKVAA